MTRTKPVPLHAIVASLALCAAWALDANRAFAARPGSFASCAESTDPPSCLIRTAIQHGGIDSDSLLEAVIETGSTQLVLPNRAMLIGGARQSATSATTMLNTLGVHLDPDASEQAISTSTDSLLIAAVALAAAAQQSQRPFDDPVFRGLSDDVRMRPVIAQTAATLWTEIDAYFHWISQLTRPPGTTGLWEAIIAEPPESSDLLVDIATTAEWYDYRDEGLALLRILEARTNATPNSKAQAASVLAGRYGLADEAQRLLDAGGAAAPNYDIDGIRVVIAEAKLRGGYDEAAARRVVNDAVSRLHDMAFQSYLDAAPRDALEAAKARAELRTLGDVYLHRASEVVGTAEDRGEWFALASDCYRRAGEATLAIQAARRGLPFVAEAVAARNRVGTGESHRSRDSARQQSVNANGFGSEPVIALYRAGAVKEALQSGYLRGFDRFRNAELAGEAPNVQWVVDDRAEDLVDMTVQDLVRTPAPKTAAALYQAVVHDSAKNRQRTSTSNEMVLGVLAALVGDGAKAKSHLARAAASLDKGSTREDIDVNNYFALLLAAEWRRAETILNRLPMQRHADSAMPTALHDAPSTSRPSGRELD